MTFAGVRSVSVHVLQEDVLGEGRHCQFSPHNSHEMWISQAATHELGHMPGEAGEAEVSAHPQLLRFRVARLIARGCACREE